jgi:hypothetical protein
VPTHIFCDEAGSTGNNLLDASQPLFAYASVAVHPDDADGIIAGLVKTHRPQGGELKGRLLVSSNRGRKLVSELLELVGHRAKVSVWNKRFALATQFFEHAFEPILSRQNSIFYNAGFHKFISNLVYIAFTANAERAVSTMNAFQKLVRARGDESIEQLFPSDKRLLESADILHDVEAFVLCHRQAVAAYIDTRQDKDPIYRWSLDASISALWYLLGAWSRELDPDAMIVTCDELKPLYEVRDRFDSMVGRSDRPTLAFPFGKHSP